MAPRLAKAVAGTVAALRSAGAPPLQPGSVVERSAFGLTHTALLCNCRHLDQKDQKEVEYKLDTFSSVYRRLTGKDVQFEFTAGN